MARRSKRATVQAVLGASKVSFGLGDNVLATVSVTFENADSAHFSALLADSVSRAVFEELLQIGFRAGVKWAGRSI